MDREMSRAHEEGWGIPHYFCTSWNTMTRDSWLPQVIWDQEADWNPPDYHQGQAPGNQLELLPSFTGWVYPQQHPPATPYLLHLCFQHSGWVPSSTTSCSILPPAADLVSPHSAPCCASTPRSPTAASAACRNIVTRLCCFLLHTGTGSRWC